jgi:tight adherence protein B
MVGLPVSTWIAAALIFLAVALGTVSLSLIFEFLQERKRKRRALSELRSLSREGFEGAGAGGTLLRGMAGVEASWAAHLAARVPHLRDVQLMLDQGGITWSIETYLLLAVGYSIGLGLVSLTLTSRWEIALALAVLGAALPYLYAKRKRKRRLLKFEEQLPESIDLLGRAIRAGHPLSSGLDMVAHESADPIATEFRRTFEEQRFGLPLDDSLLGMADRVPIVDVRILVTAIMIQRNVGGNLAEILDNLSYTIRERFKIRRQLKVYTAQGRMAGYVLAVLPIAVGVIIFFLNPDYMLTLFRDPIGKLALITASVLQTLGYYWIRRIVDIEI